MNETQAETKMASGHRKSDIGYPFSRMSQSCQLAVVISAITSYHQRNCDQGYKSNALGQHPELDVNNFCRSGRSTKIIWVELSVRYQDKICRSVVVS